MSWARFSTGLLTATAALGLSLGVSGCASISKSDCEAGNWQELGFADGAKGKSGERLFKYTEKCSKYGISVDRQAYDLAYKNGLKTYCTVDNGFRRGAGGGTYNPVCSGELEREFRQGYERGVLAYCNYDNGYDRGRDGSGYNQVCSGPWARDYRAGYQAGRAEYQVYQQFAYLENQLEDVRTAIVDVEGRLSNSDLDVNERRRLQSKLRRLQREERRLEYEIRDLRSRYGFYGRHW